MGSRRVAQAAQKTIDCLHSFNIFAVRLMVMKKAMKAMKAMKGMKAKKGVKSMSKGAICDALATATESKKSDMGKILDALAELATKETKSTGKFTIPGVCMVKTRHKPATKAGKRMASC